MAEVATAAKIPIRNVFHLLTYAWDRPLADKLAGVTPLESWDLPDLVAGVLARATQYVLKGGLDRNYRPQREALSTLRGKVLFGESLKSMLFQRAAAFCEFDEFTSDVVQNQIVKATIAGLIRSGLVKDQANYYNLVRLAARLKPISDINLCADHFRQVQFHQNNSHYRFLISVCRLAYQLKLIGEGGSSPFQGFERDKAMWRLFQKFIFNYFKFRQSDFHVHSPELSWTLEWADQHSQDVLPIMRTDVVLTSPKRIIVVDAKYYGDTFSLHHDRPRIHSGHLYQIFGYLKSTRVASPQQAVEGLVIYPTVMDQLNAEYRIQGHRIQFRTLNLAQDWKDVEASLRSMVFSPPRIP